MAGLSGYLVVLHHTLDAFPLAFESSRTAAMDLADEADPFPPAELKELYVTDGSSPVAVVVTRFEDGQPVEVAYHRDLTEEDE